MFEEREDNLLRHGRECRAVDDEIAAGRVLHRPREREIRHLSRNNERDTESDIAGLVAAVVLERPPAQLTPLMPTANPLSPIASSVEPMQYPQSPFALGSEHVLP